MHKRIICAMLAVLLAVGVSFSVHAQSSGSLAVIGSYYVMDGKFTVVVALERCASVMGGEATVEYDNTKMRLTGATMLEGVFTSQYADNFDNGRCRLFFFAGESFTGTSNVISLDFELLGQAQDGEDVYLLMTDCILSDGAEDTPLADSAFYAKVVGHDSESTADVQTQTETVQAETEEPQTKPPQTEPPQTQMQTESQTSAPQTEQATDKQSDTESASPVEDTKAESTSPQSETSHVYETKRSHQTDADDRQGSFSGGVVTAVVCVVIAVCAAFAVILVMSKRKAQ